MTKYIKDILASILLLTSLSSQGQTSDSLIHQFQWSIEKNLNYPDLLAANCIATYTVLKAEIDENGKVKDIILSDSADPLFNMEFNFIISKLDKGALEQLAQNRKLKSTSFLMPFYISVATDKCRRPQIDADNMYKVFKFNKEDFRSSAIVLPTLSSQRVEENTH